jgi:hypothetical protein
VHNNIGEKVTAIGGHFEFEKEERLPFQGYEVLYLIGHALLDTSCCGAGGCFYGFVQGFIVSWKFRINSQGFSVSEVVPLQEPIFRKRICDLIKKREMVQQVIFA